MCNHFVLPVLRRTGNSREFRMLGLLSRNRKTSGLAGQTAVKLAGRRHTDTRLGRAPRGEAAGDVGVPVGAVRQGGKRPILSIEE